MMGLLKAFAIAAATLILTTTPIFAFTGEASPETTVKEPADPDQKIKCRKLQVTGSLARNGQSLQNIGRMVAAATVWQ